MILLIYRYFSSFFFFLKNHHMNHLKSGQLLCDYTQQPTIVIAKSILALLVVLDSFLVVSQDYPRGNWVKVTVGTLPDMFPLTLLLPFFPRSMQRFFFCIQKDVIVVLRLCAEILLFNYSISYPRSPNVLFFIIY